MHVVSNQALDFQLEIPQLSTFDSKLPKYHPLRSSPEIPSRINPEFSGKLVPATYSLDSNPSLALKVDASTDITSSLFIRSSDEVRS